MRKWTIALITGLLLLLVAIYVFIPNEITIKSNVGISATRAGLQRKLLEKENVARWWPGQLSKDSFYLHGTNYRIGQGNLAVLPVYINDAHTDMTASLFFISIFTDSTQLVWTASLPTSYNPFERFRAYRKAQNLRHDMVSILDKMKVFYSKPEHIYGTTIKKVSITDTFFIAHQLKAKGYPSTEFLYNHIGQLRSYAKSKGAKENGFPINNIRTTDNENYDLIIAVPVDKVLPSSGDVLQKKLPPGCFFLEAEVKGGVATARGMFKQMQFYMDDYKLKAPALPFYSLVTERPKEPDTTKWVTRVCFPVF